MLALAAVEASYGDAQVLHRLTLDVADDEVVVLLGRNGMGKTSTIRAIMGLGAPQVTAGEIRFDDINLLALDSPNIAALGLGYVPQGRRVFGSLTVEENLLIAARAGPAGRGDWTLESIYELFPGLADRRRQRGANLSGGEQQMLAIGRALMTNPRLLLLDEPSEGLAPSIVRQVGEIIGQVRSQHMSVLIAEQDVRFAVGIADRVFVLERGRVVVTGPPERIEADEELQRQYLGVGV